MIILKEKKQMKESFLEDVIGLTGYKGFSILGPNLSVSCTKANTLKYPATLMYDTPELPAMVLLVANKMPIISFAIRSIKLINNSPKITTFSLSNNSIIELYR